MLADETVSYLALVAGSHPELFVLITENQRKGLIESLNFVSEEQFRAVSQRSGRQDAEITSQISDARHTSWSSRSTRLDIANLSEVH